MGPGYFEVDFFIHPAFQELSELKPKNQVKKTDPDFRLNENSEKVINLIRTNPYYTASELAITLGISSRAIEKIIGNLKDIGLIDRIGSRKSGYWVIIGSE